MPGDHRARRRGPAATRSGLGRGRTAAPPPREPAGTGGPGTNIAGVGQAYHHSTRVLGALVFLLGAALVVITLARGGGPLALGVVVGLALAAIGAGRSLLAGPPRGRRGPA